MIKPQDYLDSALASKGVNRHEQDISPAQLGAGAGLLAGLFLGGGIAWLINGNLFLGAIGLACSLVITYWAREAMGVTS